MKLLVQYHPEGIAPREAGKMSGDYEGIVSQDGAMPFTRRGETPPLQSCLLVLVPRL